VRYTHSVLLLRAFWSVVASGMTMTRKKWLISLALGALWIMPQFAQAYSFAGDDWLVDLNGHLNTELSALNQDLVQQDGSTTILQTSETNVVIPLNIAELALIIDVPGTVSGTHVFATTNQAGPIDLNVNNTDLRLYDITAHLEGETTSINPLDLTGGFGDRAFGITGYPTGGTGGTSYVTVGDIRVKTLFGIYMSIGPATVDIYSWNADRGEGVVPEPGTFVLLLGLAAGLAGYGWRKRRGSR
jgi:hypothetical protein